MNLADTAGKSEDNFRLLLNCRGRHTFTQEPCVYDGQKRVVYDVMVGKMDYYMIAPEDAKRSDVFDAYEKFLENMLRCADSDENPYTAVLVYEDGHLEPIVTIDVSQGYGTQETMLVFGKFGETAVLGYDGVDLRERLKRAFAAGLDVARVRDGSEDAIKGIFGQPDLADVVPPDGEEGK